jgi:hypothetical protein
MNLKTFTVATTLAIASIGAFAQAAAPATPRVDQREINQDKRIRNDVASGQLNARETYRLEQQQARVNQAESNARTDGKVTAKERAHVDNMQDRASRNIRHQKHDAQTARP